MSLPVLAKEGLVGRAEGRSRSSQASAAADTSGTRVSSVVASTDTTAIEVFGAISGSRRPFTNDNPKAETAEVIGYVASGRDMLLIGAGDLLTVEGNIYQ